MRGMSTSSGKKALIWVLSALRLLAGGRAEVLGKRRREATGGEEGERENAGVHGTDLLGEGEVVVSSPGARRLSGHPRRLVPSKETVCSEEARV